MKAMLSCRAASIALACVMALFAAPWAKAQTRQVQHYIILYPFCQGDCTGGTNPAAGVIQDAAGNLYGTTNWGGDLSCNSVGYGCGVVFKVSPKGQETVLYSFKGGTDGGSPLAGVIQDAKGNLYGTTSGRATGSFGTVFKLSTTGQETVLHSFAGGADGGEPHGGVIQDAKGNLYGTTYYGGAAKHGVVFKLSKTGKETVLYSFKGGSDGSNPAAGLIQDSMGNLYGTTYYGGTADQGVVFKLSKTGKETALYSFCSQSGCADGDRPSAVVTLDSKGNFYGTTEYGGVGYGVVFKLGKTGKETVLHSFMNDQGNNVDGAYPLAGVIQDSEGNLYGTTSAGGTYVYSGTIFKLNKAGKETVLYSLTGGGSGPLAGVIRDSKGNLYGTTYTTGFDGGAVFELKP